MEIICSNLYVIFSLELDLSECTQISPLPNKLLIKVLDVKQASMNFIEGFLALLDIGRLLKQAFNSLSRNNACKS